MRVRMFELRLIAVALTVCWTLTALLVLLGYRPGGPVDLAVGVVAGLPIAIAVAGLVWPPATHGQRAFAGMAWLGLGSMLVLVPAIADVSDQLDQRGAQTLLPSLEAAYPWAIGLLGTSLFAGFGVARRLFGETAMRRRRWVRGILIATVSAIAAGGTFTAVAMGNELALRDHLAGSSRFGPTGAEPEPPPCDSPLSVGATARLELHLAGELDGRALGSVDLAGERNEGDFRWLAYAATTRELGLHGQARIAADAWVREPFGGWRRSELLDVVDGSIDAQALSSALGQGARETAEAHGVVVLEGARARHCRVAIDGPTFRLAFPQVAWLVGDASLGRWRGDLDFWVFLDGQLGRLTGKVNGDAAEIREGAIQATVRVELTATHRGRPHHIAAPTR